LIQVEKRSREDKYWFAPQPGEKPDDSQGQGQGMDVDTGSKDGLRGTKRARAEDFM